jgi:DnaD/phage-associated family protein
MKANTIQRAPKDRENPYRLINRHAMEDDRLTFEARGVLAYILVKPDNWKIQIADLRRGGNMGRDKTYRIINELISFGYITREAERNKDGTIGETAYFVYENPQVVKADTPEEPVSNEPLPDKPDTAEPDTAEPDTAEPLPVNTDRNNKEESSKEDSHTKEEQQQPSPSSVPPSAKQENDGCRGRRFLDTNYAEVCKVYENEIGTFSDMIASELEALTDEHPKDWIIDAIRVAVTQNARRLSYVKSVLANWKRDGRGGNPAKPTTYQNGHSKPAADLTFKQWLLKTYQTDIVAAITRGTNKAEKELRDEYNQWLTGVGRPATGQRHSGQPGK